MNERLKVVVDRTREVHHVSGVAVAHCGQDEYLAMIRGYCDHYKIDIADEVLRAEAIEWRQTRGAMSGRVAWQYVQDLAGRREIAISG